jgi:3-hydroxyisobutyrate dehydrogenase
MGGGMARRLLANGFSLMVYNRNPERSKPFAAEGARVAASPREAAENAGVILSMVADDNASRALWLGQNGALAGARAGTIGIESSTVTVDWIHELATAARQRNCDLLDAPVTGSKVQAANGELNFLVGGNPETLASVRPIFSAMGRTASHIGPTGSGALLKLINNFLCGVQIAALGEALAMVERGGLDRRRGLDLLINGAAGSPIVNAIATRVLAGDYTPNFLLRLMAKDLGYAVREAEKNSLDLTTGVAALQRFQNSITHGDGEKDVAAIVEQFQK